MAEQRKLKLHRKTLRDLSHRELGAVRGGADDVQQVTRAFTGCEYCGGTNAAPRPCQETHQCTYTCPKDSDGFWCGVSDFVTKYLC